MKEQPQSDIGNDNSIARSKLSQAVSKASSFARLIMELDLFKEPVPAFKFKGRGF